MKVPAPPYKDIIILFASEDAGEKLDKREQAAFITMWPQAWPAYQQVLQELFSSYDYKNLLEDNKTQVAVERLIPNKKANDGADLLLRFSFDDSGITWDIFQKRDTIVHAQPVF
jgi:hypothetical protein